MPITVYANYGVLAHEKTPVYNLRPLTESYNTLSIQIPAALYAGENHAGDVLLKLGDYLHTLDDALRLVRSANDDGLRVCYAASPGKYAWRTLPYSKEGEADA